MTTKRRRRRVAALRTPLPAITIKRKEKERKERERERERETKPREESLHQTPHHPCKDQQNLNYPMSFAQEQMTSYGRNTIPKRSLSAGQRNCLSAERKNIPPENSHMVMHGNNRLITCLVSVVKASLHPASMVVYQNYTAKPERQSRATG